MRYPLLWAFEQFSKYTVKPNDHLRIATTFLQRPLFWSPIFCFYETNISLNNNHLSTTATNLGSQGWSLYTGLTVHVNQTNFGSLYIWVNNSVSRKWHDSMVSWQHLSFYLHTVKIGCPKIDRHEGQIWVILAIN